MYLTDEFRAADEQLERVLETMPQPKSWQDREGWERRVDIRCAKINLLMGQLRIMQESQEAVVDG